MRLKREIAGKLNEMRLMRAGLKKNLPCSPRRQQGQDLELELQVEVQVEVGGREEQILRPSRSFEPLSSSL